MSSAKRVLTAVLIVNAVIIAAAVSHGLARTGNPSRYFGEGRYIMAVSCFQLAVVAFFAARIFIARRAASVGGEGMPGHWLWALISAGFVFLVLDESLEIHEWLAGWIRGVGHTGRGEVAGRLDDALIAIYGVVALAVVWLFRREVRPFGIMLAPIVVGFVFGAASVLCDTISNGDAILLRLTAGDLALAKRLNGWFSVGDGAFMLFAEGAFVAAFYCGWRTIAGKGQAPARIE